MPEWAWAPLGPRPRYTVKTRERAKPENVKERIVRERCYKNIRQVCEHVAEFPYQPTHCEKAYRMVVVRTGRRLVCRVLGCNDHLEVFERSVRYAAA